MEKFRTLIRKGVNLLNQEDRSQDYKIGARLDRITWTIADLIAENYEIEKYFIENCCSDDKSKQHFKKNCHGNGRVENINRYEAVSDFIYECFRKEFN